MKKIKRLLIGAVLVVMVCMTLVLTGCGSETKEYLIVTDNNYEPFEYFNSENKITGIDVEILKAVAEDQDIKYTLDPIEFNAAMAAVETEQADGIIAGVGITEERKEKMDFSDAYFDSTVCAAVRKNNTAASLDSLRGGIAVALQGTQSASWAESIKNEYGLKLKYYTESDKMFDALESGKADVCFEDYPVMAFRISKDRKFKIIAEKADEYANPYAFAVKKGENSELLEKFNAGLKNIKENGKYDEIITKYLKTE